MEDFTVPYVNLLKTDVSYICSLASVCNVHDFVKSICNPKITRKFKTEKNSNFERFTIRNSRGVQTESTPPVLTANVAAFAFKSLPFYEIL